jgi:hypothetical protein
VPDIDRGPRDGAADPPDQRARQRNLGPGRSPPFHLAHREIIAVPAATRKEGCAIGP